MQLPGAAAPWRPSFISLWAHREQKPLRLPESSYAAVPVLWLWWWRYREGCLGQGTFALGKPIMLRDGS